MISSIIKRKSSIEFRVFLNIALNNRCIFEFHIILINSFICSEQTWAQVGQELTRWARFLENFHSTTVQSIIDNSNVPRNEIWPWVNYVLKMYTCLYYIGYIQEALFIFIVGIDSLEGATQGTSSSSSAFLNQCNVFNTVRSRRATATRKRWLHA